MKILMYCAMVVLLATSSVNAIDKSATIENETPFDRAEISYINWSKSTFARLLPEDVREAWDIKYVLKSKHDIANFLEWARLVDLGSDQDCPESGDARGWPRHQEAVGWPWHGPFESWGRPSESCESWVNLGDVLRVGWHRQGSILPVFEE